MEYKIRKQIEYAFYNYDKLKADASEYLSDLCSLKSPGLENLGHGSGVSNPTENAGVKLAEYNKYLWCEVVERTVTAYRWKYEYTLIRKKYVEKKGRQRICTELGLALSTYHYWLDRVLSTAEQWANELKVLKK